MIIETMTDGEIIRQLEKDMPEVESKTAARGDKFRRMVIKSTSFPFSAHPFMVTTESRNRWIVIFRAMNRKERKQISYAQTTFICTAAFSRGIYAFINSTMITSGTRQVKLMVYQPHFFARFRERIGTRKSGMDLIAEYFLKNYSYYYGLQDEDRGIAEWPDTRVYGTSQQGIGLGIIQSESRTLFKTFITYDMMHQAQFSIFTQKEILRQREIEQYQSIKMNSPLKVDDESQNDADFKDVAQKAATFTKAFMNNMIACNIAPDVNAFIDELRCWMLSSVIDTGKDITEEDQLILKNLLEQLSTYLKGTLTRAGYDQQHMEVPDDEETDRLISLVAKEITKPEASQPPLLLVSNGDDYSAEEAFPMLQSIINVGIMQTITRSPKP